ncbi:MULTISPECIES: SDR family NAD(P)-dependent oxidoreductase [Chryseobacterium]|uniref:NAD(P)-dependent dehydrogenase, short-chain alcohol dehydrogenase family n=2 Tax=Chryseobacterium TaxID=59732 RepID=A0A1N7LD13_9FLAO|nr:MULTISPECIES: SDR family oxidoreductase [Chryseobacterium]MDH5032646.1 SDR family NAD(P)-dependent oxidoreductase [Chryseobacterium cucumeris]ROH86075.1 SDR family oxidoreductase [Chryseobacterium cucumeris]SIS71687.1 NAD(P)-dependent dehydrogenase, short-chain alcohol dehydrogenase family [Chryseobacterium ureilyticum]
MKNIVIIGCGQGIGFAAAKILSENHYVIGLSRTENPEIENLNIEFHPIDILSGNLDEIIFPEVIDGLVYAPGSINLKPFNRFSIEDFRNDFEINVLGAVKTIQKLLPNLKKSETASVVLFSSVAAKLGMPFHSSISASKSAVEGLTKSMAAEFSTQKIRVNAIAPSLTDTNLASPLLSTPEKREASGRRHPLQRVGRADEIARMVAFLLSDHSAWITGQIIGIDGGMSNIKL